MPGEVEKPLMIVDRAEDLDEFFDEIEGAKLQEKTNPDTNFKVIDKRSPETQARVAEMAKEHVRDVTEMILKPCPFCGGIAKVIPFISMGESLVECSECEAKTTMFHGIGNKCVTAWNRRTPEPGTSVVRWEVFDGSPDTLPDSHRPIVYRIQRYERKAYHAGTFTYLTDGPAWIDGLGRLLEFAAMGDVWAYLPLPEPPEGIG